MSEVNSIAFGDPTHVPFWDAARGKTLVIQNCEACGQYQFYGRPFCLQCHSDRVVWKKALGTATVYSITSVRKPWVAGFEPPYNVAVVELTEGPRMMTNIVNGDAKIGDPVRVTWRERSGLPPVPVFEPDTDQ